MRPRQLAEQLAKAFPSRLKALRKAKHLTQEQLAEKAECSTVALSKFESGVNLPSFEILVSLSAGLDVDVGELLGVEDPISEQSATWVSSKAKLDEAMKDLSSDWLDALTEIAKQANKS